MRRTDETLSNGKTLLDKGGISEKVRTLAQLITKEFQSSDKELALVGIQTRGVTLAKRLAAELKRKLGHDILVGTLDITLYRDDVHAIADQPEVKETELPFDIEDRPIVLVDDVLFTGRTIRSAMNALTDYGRPQCLRLAVLIDRGGRELPIQPDYVGLIVETESTDVIDVNLTEVDHEDSVRLRHEK